VAVVVVVVVAVEVFGCPCVGVVVLIVVEVEIEFVVVREGVLIEEEAGIVTSLPYPVVLVVEGMETARA